MIVKHNVTRQGVGRMLDVEGVLELVHQDNGHLARQREAERHAEHGDAPFRDSKPLADHNSSRPLIWNRRL